MNMPYGWRTKRLRALFNETPDDSLTLQDIYQRAGAARLGSADERNAIRDTLPWLVRCGFLQKEGRGKKATFKCSGQGMSGVTRAPAMTRETKLARRREREREQRASRHPEVRERHARLLDAPTTSTVIDAETVEQFRARGGRVERLPTHWEQMERAA